MHKRHVIEITRLTICKYYKYFIYANSIALVASLSTILLLISGLPLRKKIFTRASMIIMWLTITSLAITYGISIYVITPEKDIEQLSLIIEVVVALWCSIIALLMIGNTFQLAFTGDISSICLKNIPRLVEASLLGDIEQAESLDFAKVLESCSYLEHLSLNFSNSKFVAEEGYEVPTKLPFNLNNVKQFYLPDILLVESYKLSYVCDEDDSDTDEESIEESLEPETLLDLTFNHLGEVQLGSFIERTSEMQFIKHLSANSPVLERVVT
ncbi:hypothetical protein H5410_024582 [Solanum commersonii]|uniref:PGG domain-containing protein n=1 Tax=Solanum commersonii TaxID=4109 RepID=A0A9J5ZMC0_SOLCO|nr:hypothetical protein H5410_024582 [Solanum commersonii]